MAAGISELNPDTAASASSSFASEAQCASAGMQWSFAYLTQRIGFVCRYHAWLLQWYAALACAVDVVHFTAKHTDTRAQVALQGWLGYNPKNYNKQTVMLVLTIACAPMQLHAALAGLHRTRHMWTLQQRLRHRAGECLVKSP